MLKYFISSQRQVNFNNLKCHIYIHVVSVKSIFDKHSVTSGIRERKKKQSYALEKDIL